MISFNLYLIFIIQQEIFFYKIQQKQVGQSKLSYIWLRHSKLKINEKFMYKKLNLFQSLYLEKQFILNILNILGMDEMQFSEAESNMNNLVLSNEKFQVNIGKKNKNLKEKEIKFNLINVNHNIYKLQIIQF
ncbi:unnamed protein product [Paramecium octaurelia]|uniref:Uncharacterized protein n=1 Tax=Paramecium octaurelia TaxID=43137 RepID=A0A8S1TZC0_PAROT|nr:unnamed protein product [Paramecium octaurelia]